MYELLRPLEEEFNFRKFNYRRNPFGNYKSNITGKSRSCCYELHYLNMNFVNNTDVIFHQKVPNCSTEWTAISLYKFREQRVVSFFISFIQRAALSQWEFCEQKWCHFSSVSFKELHYLSGNFVNKSDVIFHHQDFRLFHLVSCPVSTWTLSTTLMSFFIRRIPNCSTEWTAISLYKFREQRVVLFFISFIQRAALSQWEFCEQKWCHFSSVSFKELHYLSGNFVNKSDVIFHHQDFRLFHLVSCPVSTWTLSTTLMSFFIRRIPNCSTEWTAISLYKFREQRVVSFFIRRIPDCSTRWAALSQYEVCEQRVVSFFIRRIPGCSTRWAALSQYEVCEQERCHFSSVSFKELHYLSGNFVNKTDVIFHHQDFRLFHLISCTISTWTLWTRLMSFFIRRIPNCSIEWAAISQLELCEQEWSALSECEFCEQMFPSGCQIVPLTELHYLSVNFVNKNDVIFHLVNKIDDIFHLVNKSDVIFHQFHSKSCTIPT